MGQLIGLTAFDQIRQPCVPAKRPALNYLFARPRSLHEPGTLSTKSSADEPYLSRSRVQSQHLARHASIHILVDAALTSGPSFGSLLGSLLRQPQKMIQYVKVVVMKLIFRGQHPVDRHPLHRLRVVFGAHGE